MIDTNATTPSLTVELVNDSGYADSEVFLLLTGTAVATSGNNITTLLLPQATTASVTAGALGALTPGGTLVSTLTGQTCNIYSFDLTTLTSGRLLVSFVEPLVYADNAAPTATSRAMRWDKLELGFPGSGADLTSIDFFGIPLQFEYFDGSGALLSTMTYYTSTPTLLDAMYQLDTATMASAFQQVSKTGTLSYGWTPDVSPLSSFVRLLGPQTLTASNSPPAPYPSFASYLNALVASGQSFTLTGIGGVGAPAPSNNSVSYSYTGSVASDREGGYLINLTGTTTAVSPNLVNTPYGLAPDAQNTLQCALLPANLPVTLALAAGAFDNAIYAAEATAYAVGQSTSSSGPSYLEPSLVPYAQNSVYASIAGDFIAALHFGYAGGNCGSDSGAWYSSPPTAYPFAGARATNDGFYNAFAAVLYNLSDAYGFPFSDRGGRPSPYVPLPPTATTMRITVLADSRLDAPQVTNVTSTDTTLVVTWGAVAPPDGFALTGYTVTISPPIPATSQTVAATVTTATFKDLDACTSYTLSITANGTANGQSVQSYALPLSAATIGQVAPLTGDIDFQITLNWGVTTPTPPGTTFQIDGQAYTPSATAAPIMIKGQAGLNTVPLRMLDAAGNVVYSGNYAIQLAGSSGSYTVAATGPFLLAGNSVALVAAGPPGTPPYDAGSAQSLSVGTPFAPSPGKQINPVVFPGSQTGAAS